MKQIYFNQFLSILKNTQKHIIISDIIKKLEIVLFRPISSSKYVQILVKNAPTPK
jgi:hypothetical protein